MRRIGLLFCCLTNILVQAQIFDNQEVFPLTETMSYNSTFKGYSAGGMVYYDYWDSTTVKRKETMTCCFDDTSKFYHRSKFYYENGILKLDSMINMMAVKKAKLSVKRYSREGTIIYEKRFSAPLDKKREELPKRSDVFWSGKLIKYDRTGKPSKKIVKVTQ